VRSGETFTVTDHGTSVALLVPLPSASDDPLADLVAAGRVLPPSRPAGTLPAAAVAETSGPTATEVLLAERRADGRASALTEAFPGHRPTSLGLTRQHG
jgi:antitoxin (DNA-binding transcriptional repressor) of toxin-antitoxin stability system